MTNAGRMKLIVAAALLCYVPFTTAGEKETYPTEKIAAFVVDNFDVTSLPSVLRPKKEKGKKTFADYGYTTQNLDDKKALEALSAGDMLSITILQQNRSGIYACVAKVVQDQSDPTAQSVILIKRQKSGALLKGSESSREFDSCPHLPADDSSSY